MCARNMRAQFPIPIWDRDNGDLMYSLIASHTHNNNVGVSLEDEWRGTLAFVVSNVYGKIFLRIKCTFFLVHHATQCSSMQTLWIL